MAKNDRKQILFFVKYVLIFKTSEKIYFLFTLKKKIEKKYIYIIFFIEATMASKVSY